MKRGSCVAGRLHSEAQHAKATTEPGVLPRHAEPRPPAHLHSKVELSSEAEKRSWASSDLCTGAGASSMRVMGGVESMVKGEEASVSGDEASEAARTWNLRERGRVAAGGTGLAPCGLPPFSNTAWRAEDCADRQQWS